MSKVKITTDLSYDYFDLDLLKEILNKHQVDIEKAVNLSGKILTPEFEETQVEVTGNYNSGRLATYLDPEEYPEMEITDIGYASFMNQLINLEPALTKKFYDRMKLYLWEQVEIDNDNYHAGLCEYRRNRL